MIVITHNQARFILPDCRQHRSRLVRFDRNITKIIKVAPNSPSARKPYRLVIRETAASA